MMDTALWQNKFYVQAVTGVLGFFFLVGGTIFIMQKRNPKWIGVWASIKSWVITSPVVFFFAALPRPWPLVFLVMLAIFGAKTFYRMTGMFHRSWFVWLTYFFIILQGVTIYRGRDHFFDIIPMIFLTVMILIPIFRNAHNHMIQYIALALINFMMMGWGFMHLGRIVMWEGGALITLYLAILFEFCEASNYALNRAFGRTKPLGNITTRFSVEGFVLSMILTLLLAWGLRGMVPGRDEIYWISAGLAVSVVGRLGGIFLSVIRRDLNIKESGIFIIGRDDLLSRVDKPVFAAPAFYYAVLILQGHIQI